MSELETLCATGRRTGVRGHLKCAVLRCRRDSPQGNARLVVLLGQLQATRTPDTGLEGLPQTEEEEEEGEIRLCVINPIYLYSIILVLAT